VAKIGISGWWVVDSGWWMVDGGWWGRSLASAVWTLCVEVGAELLPNKLLAAIHPSLASKYYTAIAKFCLNIEELKTELGSYTAESKLRSNS